MTCFRFLTPISILNEPKRSSTAFNIHATFKEIIKMNYLLFNNLKKKYKYNSLIFVFNQLKK